MNDIIFEIINLVLMIIAAVIAKYLVPWLKEKIGTEKLSTIAQWAQKAVLYAEQIMTAATGEEKKDAVTEIIKEIVEANNISITDKQIEILIESAVKQMNMDSMVVDIELDEEIEANPESESIPDAEPEAEETAEPESDEKVEVETGTTAVVGESAVG